MGRSFAGVLGSLAFLVELGRGLIHGGGFENTVLAATIGLFGFAAIGYLIGRLAEWTVREAIEAQLAMELAAQESEKATVKTTKRG